MKKRIFAILFALVMLVSAFGVVAQAETQMYVLVSNSLISEGYMAGEELTDLQVKGIEVENIYGYAALFAIIDEELIDAYESAESLYSQLTDNPNGIIVVHDDYNDKYDYYLAGDCEDIFAGEISRVIDEYDVAETYYGGVVAYYLKVEDVLTAFNAVPGNDVYTDGYIDGDNGGDIDYDYQEDLEADAEDDIEAPVEDEEELPYIIDDAGLLKDSEIKELDKKYSELSKKYGIDFVAVTVEDTDGLSIDDYADMMYEYIFEPCGKSDVAFVIYKHGDEGERKVVITCYGKAESELSDADCTKIINAIKGDFADGKYAKGFEKFVEETESVFNPSVHWIWIPGCLVIGFVIAYLIMKGIASANKSVRKKVNAAEYVLQDTLMVTNAADIFLYTETKSTPKANNSTSSSDTDAGGRSTSSGKF